MNFSFKLGDIVVLRTDLHRQMVLVKEFVDGIFWAQGSKGILVRVRTAQLLRVRRPSDDIKQQAVDLRKLERAKLKVLRNKRREENIAEFKSMEKLGVRLTADGMPDQRIKKLKFSAVNAPVIVKIKPRGL
jgi:hypothetical protein